MPLAAPVMIAVLFFSMFIRVSIAACIASRQHGAAGQIDPPDSFAIGCRRDIARIDATGLSARRTRSRPQPEECLHRWRVSQGRIFRRTRAGELERICRQYLSGEFQVRPDRRTALLSVPGFT